MKGWRDVCSTFWYFYYLFSHNAINVCGGMECGVCGVSWKEQWVVAF